MEAVSLNGYAAQGSITVNGETLTKRCGFNADGCLSLQNAKRNVLKGLGNKVRSRTLMLQKVGLNGLTYLQ